MRPGKASKFVLPFKIVPGKAYVVLCRVSSCDQGKKGNLKGQVRNLVNLIEDAGGLVVPVSPDKACFEFEWSGHGEEWHAILCCVAEFARKHDATVVAATLCRLIRNPVFRSNHSQLCKLQARESDLEDLRLAMGGVPVMTYLDPDASPGECRSLLIRWGQGAKGHKGGRGRKRVDQSPGYRKRRKAACRPLAVDLYRRGASTRFIERRASRLHGSRISRQTILNWLREAGREGLIHYEGKISD
jgi:hypothetical protein